MEQRRGGDTTGRSRVRWLLTGIAVLAVLAIVGLTLLVWYIFFRPAGPDPIGPGAPVIPDGAVSGSLSLLVAMM